MPSSSRKRFHKTLGFRLTFWYSSIFILSSLILSIVSFAFVFSTMRDNRKAIQLQLAQYRSIADAGGVQAIENSSTEQGRPSQRRSFFVRVIAPGDKTVLLSNPRLWEEFDFRRVDWQTEGNGSISPQIGMRRCSRLHRRGWRTINFCRSVNAFRIGKKSSRISATRFWRR